MIIKSILLSILGLSGCFTAYAEDGAWESQIVKIDNDIKAHPADIRVLTKGVIAYNNYAMRLLKNKDYENAVAYFKKAIAIAPQQQSIKDNLSSAYLAWAQNMRINSNSNDEKVSYLVNKSLEYNKGNTQALALSQQLEKFAEQKVSNVSVSNGQPENNSVNTSFEKSAPLYSLPENMPINTPTNMPTVSSDSKPNSALYNETAKIMHPQVIDLMIKHGARTVPSSNQLADFMNKYAAGNQPNAVQVSDFIKQYGATTPVTDDELQNFLSSVASSRSQ